MIWQIVLLDLVKDSFIYQFLLDNLAEVCYIVHKKPRISGEE